MLRYIPGKTRVKTEFFKNITFGDIILAIICLVFAIIILASNLFKIGGGDYRMYALMGWNNKPMETYVQKRPDVACIVVTALLAVGFTVFVSFWTVSRVLCLSTPTYDMGIFSQMFYSMRTTGLPITTVERDGPLSHFMVHVSPIYYLMLPFYCLFPKAETLQVLQAVVLASSVIPLWLLAGRKNLPAWQRTALCALLLFYPALSGGTSYDLHENCFLTPLLLWLEVAAGTMI